MHRRLITVVAIVMILAMPATRMVVGTIVGVVHCCCGAHSVTDKCGCPDCPTSARPAQTQGSEDLPGPPSLKPCYSELDLTPPMMAPVFTTAQLALTAAPGRTLRLRPHDERLPPSLPLPPLLEPPEPS